MLLKEAPGRYALLHDCHIFLAYTMLTQCGWKPYGDIDLGQAMAQVMLHEDTKPLPDPPLNYRH